MAWVINIRHCYVMAKRAGKVPNRPIADTLFGAFPSRFDGLFSRNLRDFWSNFLKLNLVLP